MTWWRDASEHLRGRLLLFREVDRLALEHVQQSLRGLHDLRNVGATTLSAQVRVHACKDTQREMCAADDLRLAQIQGTQHPAQQAA